MPHRSRIAIATVSLALSVALSLAGRAAHAAPAAVDWAALVPPAALATHVDGSARDLLVVGVGDARGAAEVLRGALRATGRLRSVMLTGAPPALDDRALIARADAAGADTLAIARIAEGPTLLVAFYDRTGASLGGFSVEPGRPLVARAGQRIGGARGVSESAATAVDNVLRDRRAPDGAPRASAEEQYAREHLGLFNVTGYSARTGVVLATWIQPYQGQYKQPISVGDFFDKVDPVRGAAYKKGVRTRIALAGAGGGGMLVGLGVALGGLGVKDPTGSSALFGVGGALGVAGVACLFAAPFVRLPSVDVYEAVRLVDRYNANLRARLRLTDASVSVTSDGASFGVGGTF
jgi:hypothetical protein